MLYCKRDIGSFGPLLGRTCGSIDNQSSLLRVISSSTEQSKSSVHPGKRIKSLWRLQVCKFAMSHQSGPPLASSDCWQSPPSLSETAFRPRAQFSPGAKLCIACLSATTRAAPAPIYASAHPLMSGELFTAALI